MGTNPSFISYPMEFLFRFFAANEVVPLPTNGSSTVSPTKLNILINRWNFSGEKQDKHLAMFPEELPGRLIKMFSFVGDTVLDPFVGSGTTSLAAKNLNRNSIGYEINEGFVPIIKLPYIFKDPIKFDKKIDPRKLKFGSKIDNSHSERETYYTVKEIVSPEKLILNNGLKVRLLGVKEIEDRYVAAVQFIKEKTQGQKVFLRFDNIKYDDTNNLFCYLYLWNKTLLNAHLIKNRLVEVDTTIDFKYKLKFLEIYSVIGDKQND